MTEYKTPELKIVIFEDEDVITASGNYDGTEEELD